MECLNSRHWQEVSGGEPAGLVETRTVGQRLSPRSAGLGWGELLLTPAEPKAVKELGDFPEFHLLKAEFTFCSRMRSDHVFHSASGAA